MSDLQITQITQIDHVSVLITDVERSRRFYRDLLGLKEIAKPRTFDFIALWFELGNQQLHLLRKEQPDTRSPRHFALRVKDVPAARIYMRERGVAVEETMRFRDAIASSCTTPTAIASKSSNGSNRTTPQRAER